MIFEVKTLFVTILEEEYSHRLEDSINNWIRDHSDYKVIDIKYSGNGSAVPHGSSKYSAMIMYCTL